MKSSLALPFLILALCSAPSIAQSNAVVQTEPYKGPHDDALRYIVEVGAAEIEITPDKRGDLSGCNGAPMRACSEPSGLAGPFWKPTKA